MKQVWVKRPTCSLDRVHHGGDGVADAGHRDAGSEVDEGVAVDVDEDGALARST